MLNDYRQAQFATSGPPVALVVDDDPAQRAMLRAMLMRVGIKVEEAENGAVALSLFERFTPDIVLMDVRMPVMDGIEACCAIRKLAAGRDTPIILITALDDHESISRAFDADATDFITKPVNWPILSHRVDYFLKSGKALKALRRSESRLNNAQEIAVLGCWEFDLIGNKVQMSEQVFHIFGQEPTKSVFHELFRTMVHPEDINVVLETSTKALAMGLPYSLDYRIVLRDGSQRTINEQAKVNFSLDGIIVGMYGTVQDITKRKMAENKIHRLAYYDTLTGLPNRDFFKKRAKKVLARARDNETKIAIMFIDLDNFKRVNDVYGHGAGDVLLKKVAQNLMTGLRASDFVTRTDVLGSETDATISRLGGDEFTLLLDGFTDQQQVSQVAQRIHEQLCQSVVIDGHELIVTGSVGISVFPDDGADLDTLLKHADTAMYQNKNNGRSGFQFFSKDMQVNTASELSLEVQLRKAIDTEQLLLHYQPQVEIATGKIIGLEALLRWQDPVKGMIPPEDFISLAEKSGLIIPIGEWVLRTACRQAINWQQAGLTPVKVSVNISGRQFSQPNLVNIVQQILSETALPPRYLELEITENSLIDKMDDVYSNLAGLKKLGVSIAVDDFGTGYSSLSYLKRLPIDTLKIDKSFIDDMAIHSNDGAIVKAIIDLAISMDLNTIAEGVESDSQLSLLQRQGCNHIQGYLFSKPLAVDEISDFIERQARHCLIERITN